MTKEKLMFEAEVYNKGLTSHPMTEQMLIAVLAGFGEHLQLLQQTPCTTQLPSTESQIEFIERRFVTADGIIYWNDQVKGYLSQKLGQ